MKVLISTFADGDLDRLLLAMRALPYDELILISENGCGSSADLERIARLEEMAGHELRTETVARGGLMAMVDNISDIIASHARDRETGQANHVVVNISGGSKLMGDAALLASFRLGVETVHCDSRLVRLPVIRDATATDMFTPLQLRMIELLEKRSSLQGLIQRMSPSSKQATERVIRDLRRAGLIDTHVREGVVHLDLSASGREVLRAITLGRNDG